MNSPKLALALIFFGVCVAAASPIKKGVGDTSGQPALIDGMNVGWYYNWTPNPASGSVKAEFVPMIWSDYFATPQILSAIKADPRVKSLLAFNEPDSQSESDMTPQQAVDLWPKLMDTGKRLGSPAVTESGQGMAWLDQFMTMAGAKGYRVDFICVHWYDDVTLPQSASILATFLTNIHDKYRKPIWLTEFSGGNWAFIANKPLTYQHNVDFIAKALPLIEAMPFVERYAWFATISDQGMFKASYEKASLYDGNTGRPTVVGDAYRRDYSRTEMLVEDGYSPAFSSVSRQLPPALRR